MRRFNAIHLAPLLLSAACDMRGSNPEPRNNLVPPGETIGKVASIQDAAKILHACDSDDQPDGGLMKITVMAAHLENGDPRFAVGIDASSNPETALCIIEALAP